MQDDGPSQGTTASAATPMDEGEASLLTVPTPATPAEVTNDRYKHFMGILNKCFAEMDQVLFIFLFLSIQMLF